MAQSPAVFTRAHEGNTWYALAGIDVEQAPGTYPLDLTATATNGHQLHATRKWPCCPGLIRPPHCTSRRNIVQPDAATLQRIAADKSVKDAAFAHQISQPLWRGSFRSPVPFAADRFLWDSPYV